MKQTEKNDVIVTQGVTKVYAADGIPVNALAGIDLTIRSGEFTALMGPSGSGKTTFLNIISGLDAPTEGKVWLSGRVLSDISGNELSDFRRDNIGFIFQAYNLIPVLTVEENVEYIMLLQRVPKAETSRASYGNAGSGRAARVCRPESDTTFGRTAAARCHCTCHGLRTEDHSRR